MAGTDDLFSRLFELFNQPGPVNSKLAAEVAHHIVGAAEPVDPWAAEEMRDLAHLAEFRLEGSNPPAQVPTLDLHLLDQRSWVDRNLVTFQYLVEPLAGSLGSGSASGPLGPFLPSLGPALAGIQLGSTVAAMAQSAMGHFDLPLPGQGPLALIGSTLDEFAAEHALDKRQVRLWAVISELANRVVWNVGWVAPHLSDLLAAWIEDLKPEVLLERLSAYSDPEELRSMLEGGDRDELIESLQGDPAKREPLEVFLAVVAGYTQQMVATAAGDLLPNLDEIRGRWLERPGRVWPPGQTAERMAAAFEFLEEIGRRFGPPAWENLIEGPASLPTPAELNDPVAWAARVLLDEML